MTAPTAPSGRIIIQDSGTLDTVLLCRECGQLFTFTFEGFNFEYERDEWLKQLIVDTEQEHTPADCRAFLSSVRR